MRLTLRTMLAYMDDILEPADHEDVGRKIEESEFANNLVHRIRDVTQRMRLGVPKVSGRGMGLDPNTVAEYLDNVLSGERVPDFEKVCLESDVHLAEVAACHQILTLVLGEPAEFEPATRQRMYDIGNLGSAPVGAATAAVAAAALPVATPLSANGASTAADNRPTPLRDRPEVPDYLRSGRRPRFWPVSLTILLACGLVVAIILAAGQGENVKTALRSVFGDKKEVARADDNGKEEHQAGDTKAHKQPLPADKVNDKGEAPGDNGAKPLLPTPSEPPAGTAKPGVVPTGFGPTPVPPNLGGSKSLVVLPPAPSPSTPDDHTGLNTPPRDVPGNKGAGPAPAAIAPAAVIPPVPKGPPAGGGANDLASGGVAGPLTGHLIGNQEMLLRLAADTGDWRRAAARVAFGAGDRLLALPTFRPTVTVAHELTLQLWPETQIKLEGVDAEGVAVVRLDFGRMVQTTGNANVRVKLLLGTTGGTLTFSDPQAVAAAEVHPYLLPGTDPDSHPAKTAINVYATSGQVLWLDAAAGAAASPPGGLPPQGSHLLKAPTRVVLAAGPPESAGSDHDLPKWLGAEIAGPLDIKAAQILSQALDEKASVTVALRDLTRHRREEVRSLAARSLALVDEFDPFIPLFDDMDQRRVWPTQIESLQSALARGPSVASKVRATFEKQQGKEGYELYRMLWGYSKQQLQGSDGITLVDYLDHDDPPAFRVLAFYNLRQITGKTFDYRPESTASARAASVRRWRDQLKEGLIVPKGPPAAKPSPLEGPSSRVPPPPPPPPPLNDE